MKKRVMQVYALLICLVAVISFLISITSLVSTLIDYTDPLNSGRSQISLSSLEYFKMDLLKTTTKEQFYIPSDEEIAKMYEDAKSQHFSVLKHRITKDVIVYSLLLVLSAGLFYPHWRILQKQEDGD